jgi:hypothetical protein
VLISLSTLGEHVCLYDEDDKSVTSLPDNAEFRDDFDINKNVEILADNIIKDLAEINGSEDEIDGRCMRNSLETTERLDVHATNALSNSRLDSPKEHYHTVDSSTSRNDLIPKDGPEKASHMTKPVQDVSQVGGLDSYIQVEAFVDKVGVFRKRRLKISTISSDDTRSLRSGPWSVDWLRNVQ